jgi:predicted PurR-regulated permease PerM
MTRDDESAERSARQIGWRSRDIMRTALLLATIWVLLQLLWVAHSLVFVAFLGTLFGLALAGGVDWLKRFGVPRGIGAILIVAAFLSVLAGLGTLLAPTLREQTIELRTQLPQAIDRLETWLERQQGGVVGMILGADPDPDSDPDAEPGAEPVEGARSLAVLLDPDADEDDTAAISLRERVTGEFGQLTRYLFPFLTSTLAALAGVLMVLFIAIYIAVQPDLYLRGLMHLFPHRSRRRAGEVLTQTATMLRRWLVTQLIAMVAIGIITTVTLLVLQVPSAIALGVLAGLLEFIPIFGPIIASIPAIAVAFLDSPQKALAVAAAYIVIQQVESQIITPILFKEGMDLPPVLTIVVQATMALVFGFIGLIVAVPMLGAALVPIKMLYVEDVVGDAVELPDDSD